LLKIDDVNMTIDPWSFNFLMILEHLSNLFQPRSCQYFIFFLLIPNKLTTTWTTCPPLWAISRSRLWHLWACSNRTSCCWINLRFSGSAELGAGGPPAAPNFNKHELIIKINLSGKIFFWGQFYQRDIFRKTFHRSKKVGLQMISVTRWYRKNRSFGRILG